MIKKLARWILRNEYDLDTDIKVSKAYACGIRYGFEQGKIYGSAEMTGRGVVLGLNPTARRQIEDIIGGN